MRKRTLLRRITSAAVSLALIFSTGLSALPEGAFAITAQAASPSFALSGSQLALGANVIPNALASDSTFMKKYVKASGTTLSLNSEFKKTGVTANVKGASDTLPTGTLSPSSSSKYWIAQYKWTTDAADRALVNSDSYDLVYEASLIPNKHGHLIGEDHWNDAYVTIRTKDWNGSSNYGYQDTGIIYGKSTQRNNRVTLDVKETLDVSLGEGGFLTYTAKHSGGQACGGPSVSGSVFYLVDNATPRITNIYLASDADGNNSLNSYNAFGNKDKITAYTVLEFSEDIRMADNYSKTDGFTLDLEAYYGADSGYTENSNYNLTATLVKLEGKKMVFEFSVPAAMNGKNTNIYITGIKNSQSFNQSWDLKLFDGTGAEFATTGLTAGSRITDIAGNSLNWDASTKGMSYYYFDNVAPKLESISMTGKMITASSTKEPTSWIANTEDRDATFAGVGDKLGFQVNFSEGVSNTNGLKAVLSIKDESGNPVELGVQRVSGNCVTFKEFTVTDTMIAAGSRIVITSFKNGENITDYAGNKIATDMSKDIIPPKQQIYLDVDKPMISTSMTAVDEVYHTNNETAAGECFSFPIIFKEDTTKAKSPYYSMINDCPVEFSIETPRDSIGFSYYADTASTWNDSKYAESGKRKGMTGSTAGQYRYEGLAKVSDGVQYYLHIRLDSDNDYSDISTNVEADGVYFNGTLHLYAKDWAGNTATNSFTVKHQVDTEAPTGGIESNLKSSVDYANGVVTFTGNIWVKDNYGLDSLTYTWYYRVCDEYGNLPTEWTSGTPVTINKSGMGSGTLVESYRKAVQFSTPAFDVNNGVEGRVGEAYLKISCTDIPGNGGAVTVTSPTISFDYRKPTGNYTIETGDVTAPLTKAYLELSAATSTNAVAGQYPRTLVMVKHSDGFYWVYDPMKADGSTEYYFEGNIFEPVYNLTYDKSTNYGTWYMLNYDSLTEADENGVVKCTNVQVATGNFMSGLLDALRSYAIQEVTLVTANFNGTYAGADTKASVFDYILNASSMETYPIYLANDAEYSTTFTAAKNAEGADIAAVLDYSSYEDGNTCSTLDNVSVTFAVTNESDTANVQYGFAAVDYTKSNVTFRYHGKEKPASDAEALTAAVTKTWPLAQTADGVQTIVFDKGLSEESGWYSLTVTVANLNGTLYTKTQYYLVDTTELNLTIDTYYKNYQYGYYDVLVRDGKEGSLYSFNEETKANSEIILSLAETPSSWRQNTYLKFSRSHRADSLVDINENIKIRVRNATYDALNGEADTTAVWANASSVWADDSERTDLSGMALAADREHYYYVPTLVSGYTDGAYGAAEYITSGEHTKLTIPMLEGYNLLVYEIKNTNGIVTSKEIPVFVYGEVEDWSLDYSFNMHNDNIQSVTVSPMIPNNPSLTGCGFYNGIWMEENWDQDSNEETTPLGSYTIYKDVNTNFFLLDQNGNMSAKRLQLLDENGELLDVDGIAPYQVTVQNGYTDKSGGGYDGQNFCFVVTGYDLDSLISAKDLTVTFDKDYSAVLMGMSGADRANNQTQITASIPLAVDANGNYLMNEDGTYAVWEAHEVGNYGIYRTQILEEVTEESSGNVYTGMVSVKVWGTWKYDEECQSYYDEAAGKYYYGYSYDTNGDGIADTTAKVPEYWTLTFNVADTYGNVASAVSGKGSYDTFSNSDYRLLTGTVEESGYYKGYLNIDKPLDSENILGIACNVPLASIDSNGSMPMQEVLTSGQQERWFFTTAPMIVADGDYTFHVTDLFGEEYDLDLSVYAFGELGVDVSFSTTAPTNEPVTVMAVATGNVEEITSIISGDGEVGTIDPVDSSVASITVENNCTITITTSSVQEDGSYLQRVVRVNNIDKAVDDTYVEFFDYTYSLLTGNETEVEGEVTVYLLCDTETIYTTNGPGEYTFPEGSSAGDSYTFEYMDAAGNVGTYTVTLPFDIVPVPPVPDTEAPDVLVSMYGMRNNKSEYLTDLFNPIDDETDEGFAAGGTLINAEMVGYKAQQFRFVLSITDASDTKVIVQAAGAAAPTDYNGATAGSTVDFVGVSAAKRAATLTITENGKFDLYVIDANNNVAAITGIDIKDVDNVAPQLYADYEVGVDAFTGLPIVTAQFLPVLDTEKFEPIIPITTKIFSKRVPLETGEYEELLDENGEPYQVPITQDVTRYYTIFDSNGAFTFHYRDEYGNLSQAVATIKGMDTSAAVVNAVIWYGTVGNVLPSKSPVVNRNVIVELDMNKPISNVELYVYNEQMENGAGELLPTDAPVEVSFTGNNVYVTYTENVNYQIVVQFTASASGRKGYYTLPTVGCIDKDAPVVTMVGNPVLAADNRSATVNFRTNEQAILSQKAGEGYGTEHVWIATTNAKELYFTDKAGNQTTYTLKDLGIDEAMLTVLYSAAADGTDATQEPLEDLELDSGDTFYVNVSKAASGVLDGVAVGDVAAGTWTPIQLSEEAGLHIVQFKDKNTGEIVYDLVAAQPKDNIAPVIELASSTVVVDEGVTLEEMLTAVRTGVTVTDDVDETIDYTVTGYPESVTAGLYSLEYTAQDAAGNSATVYRSLYIMAEGTPILWINGEPGLPYGKVVIKNGESITLKLENMMEDEPVIIKYLSGIKTSGQMKYYATTVENMNFSVSEPGHYTIYVRSQDRVEYVTYIYVEDK